MTTATDAGAAGRLVARARRAAVPRSPNVGVVETALAVPAASAAVTVDAVPMVPTAVGASHAPAAPAIAPPLHEATSPAAATVGASRVETGLGHAIPAAVERTVQMSPPSLRSEAVGPPAVRVTSHPLVRESELTGAASAPRGPEPVPGPARSEDVDRPGATPVVAPVVALGSERAAPATPTPVVIDHIEIVTPAATPRPPDPFAAVADRRAGRSRARGSY
jgi:hypothetical protein